LPIHIEVMSIIQQVRTYEYIVIVQVYLTDKTILNPKVFNMHDSSFVLICGQNLRTDTQILKYLSKGMPLYLNNKIF